MILPNNPDGGGLDPNIYLIIRMEVAGSQHICQLRNNPDGGGLDPNIYGNNPDEGGPDPNISGDNPDGI